MANIDRSTRIWAEAPAGTSKFKPSNESRFESLDTLCESSDDNHNNNNNNNNKNNNNNNRTGSKLAPSLLILSLFLGVFLVALDQTIVGTAVPSITTEFKALDDIAWYGSGYLLTVTAFQPTFGKIYLFMNAKVVFMTCVLIFEVGSILCAAAPSSAVFIVGRAVAGVGAAGLFQGALAIITKTIGLKNRPVCISVVTSTFAVSVAIGPVIGGVFSDRVTWRWCFWINVPIGAIVLILIFFILHLPPTDPNNKSTTTFATLTLRQKLRKLDPLGAVLIVGAVVSLLLALQWGGGGSKPWGSGAVVGLLVAAAALLALFALSQWWWCWGAPEDATVPLALLRMRSVLAGGLFCFFFAMPTYSFGYYIPIYFQAAKGATAIESGTQYLALALPQILAVVISGSLVTLIGVYVPFMILGTAVALVGSGLFLMLDLQTSTALWAVFLVICGIGTGFAINLPYTIVQVVLPDKDVPTGNAMFQFLFQLGGALSLSISQTVFLSQLKASAERLTPSVPYNVLTQAGAYNLRGIADSEELYNLLRRVYMNALHDTYIFPVVVTGLALIATFALEHKNIKKISKDEEKADI